MPVRLQFHQQQTTPNGQPLPLFRGTDAARLIGGGITRLGAQLEAGQKEYEAKVERQQAQDSATMALRITAETRSTFANRMTELQENGEPGLPGFTGTVANEYRQHMDSALERVPDWARNRVQRSLLVYGDSLSQQAMGVETKARWTKRADDLTAGIRSTVDTVERSPGDYQSLRAELVSGIEDSQLPPAMRRAAMEQVDREMPGAYARGRVAANPAAVVGSFNSRFESSDSIINGMPLQDRMRIKARADQVLNSRMASARADVANRWNDHAAATEAGNGHTVKPLTLPEFQAAYGGAKGAVKFAQYRSDVDMANVVHTMQSMDADQLDNLRATFASHVKGPGAAEGARLLGIVDRTIASIERDRRQTANEERANLANTLNEEIAAAVEGEEPNRLSLDAFLPAYESVTEAQEAYRNYLGTIDAMALHQDIQDDPPAEAQGKVMSRFDSAYEMKRRGDALGEIDKIRKRREADPAGEVLKFSEPVQQAWLDYRNSDDLGDRRSAARHYIETMEQEQERLGVPADKRRLLPDGFIKETEAQIADAMSPENANGEALIGTLQQLRSDFGDRWPEAAGELMAEGALKGHAIPIASGMAPGPAMTLAKAAGMKRGDFNLKQGDAKAIDSYVTEGLDDFRQTLNPLFGVTNGPELFATYREAAARLADVYVSTGQVPSEAAKRAAKEVITERYEFNDSWRVPKQAAVNAGGFGLIREGARYYQDEIAGSQIAVIGAEQAQVGAREAIASGSKWITSPDERGLVLMYDGGVVENYQGQPIALSWEDLATVGRAYRADTNMIERLF